MTQEEFEYLSTQTPIVNVDLLIKNKKDQVLLSWRDDHLFYGWHLPGRCVRFKETLSDAVKQCSLLEIGWGLSFDPHPILIQEDISAERDIRGHFISFLFLCYYDIDTLPLSINVNKKESDNGYLNWFDSCPDNLLECQKKNYEKYFIK